MKFVFAHDWQELQNMLPVVVSNWGPLSNTCELVPSKRTVITEKNSLLSTKNQGAPMKANRLPESLVEAALASLAKEDTNGRFGNLRQPSTVWSSH